MDGITFAGNGPIMDGTWTNPYTGDSFTVGDSYFEDGQYKIRAVDGRIFRYDDIQDYIKGIKQSEIKNIKEQNKLQSIPKEVSDIIATPDDNNLICDDDMAALGNIYNQEKPSSIPTPEPIQQLNNTPHHTNINDAIVEKALGKIAPPRCNVTLFWDYFPEKEIKALVDVMGVDINDIIMWYINKMDFETIANSIRNAMMTQMKLMEKEKSSDSNNPQIKVLEEPKAKKSVKKNAKRKSI